MNKNILRNLSLIVAILVACIACSHKENGNGNEKEAIPSKPVQFTRLNLRPVEIGETVKFEGFIIGRSYTKNEVYVKAISALKGKYSLLVVDIPTGKVKKEKQLRKGVHESPTDFFNPSYMQYLEGRYFIIDQYSKILVYDEQLNYLFTNMFDMHRYYIDFYRKDGQTYFLGGHKRYGQTLRLNNVRIFRFPDKKRPEEEKFLYQFVYPSLSYKKRQNRKNSYTGMFWPSGTGFEKDGGIYAASYDEQQYHVYNIDRDEKLAFELNYLKPKTYSVETATKFYNSYSSDYFKRYLAKRNLKHVIETYSKPIYHYGIYDVGVGKIGIIGDILLNKFQIRLDVLDAAGVYIESITLPFGDGLGQNITDSARGMAPTYIDIDRGYYLWNDAEGEDDIDYARITTFTVRRDQTNETSNENPI